MIASYSMVGGTLKDLAAGLAHRYMKHGSPDPGYQNDLCLQGLLCMYDASGDDTYLRYVQSVLQRRGSRPVDALNWRTLFTDLHSELWLRTHDPVYLEGWLDDLHALMDHLPFDDHGRIVFFLEPEKKRLLIDMLQGYCLRLSRAGSWTGNPMYFHHVADQFQRHAEVLVNPQNGLWHHGRGWHPEQPHALAPEGWCRGQAWVLRGLVESMATMPATSSAFHKLHALLIDLTAALLRYQDQDGMWRQLVHQTQSSYPETSGTAMIVYYLGKAWRRGWLTSHDLVRSLTRAQAALRFFIDQTFRVYNGCPHLPPQRNALDYLFRSPAIDDRHAMGAMMMALSLPLEGKDRRANRQRRGQAVTAPKSHQAETSRMDWLTPVP